MAGTEKVIENIRELRDYYVNELYSNVRKEQNEDKSYIDDTFAVPEVKEPHKPMRMGTGADIVDSPAEQIITSNPQVFIKCENAEVGIRISRLINEKWIPILKRMNPNPFKEFVKNLLSRGESHIKLTHNPEWVTGELNKNGLPVFFSLLDPMVIYASPEEDDNGIPARVVVYYERQPKDVIVHYSSWSNPKKKGLKVEGQPNKEDKYVQWFEYWDKDHRYFEADGEAVLNDRIQPNLYKFSAFIRKYSGFGKRSPDGDLSKLIVSDIKKNRDLIRKECVIGSDIVSILSLFAHRPKNIILPMGTEISQDQIDELKFGAYALNVLNLPEGSKYDNEEPPEPTPEMFKFWADISGRIRQRNPFLMAGFPMGQSGRQQDMSEMTALRRYDTVVENTEHAWATAFEKALAICNLVPGLYPAGLNKEDLTNNFTCFVKLRAEDQLESDRRATLGSRLVSAKEIDPITNLVEYKGYTKERAEEIMVDMMAWQVLLTNPDIAELIGLRAIEKAGMADDIEAVKQRRLFLEKQQKALVSNPSQSIQERQTGEVASPMGRDMIDMALQSRGVRKPPLNYTRNK